MNNSIEVFVLTRNRKLFLLETLESLLAQRSPADRIVVLDNCSTDGSPEAVYARFGERVEVLTSEAPLSLWENFARAGQQSRSLRCMVAHDDDLYHPNYLEAVRKSFEKRPDVGIVLAGMSYEYHPNPTRWAPLTEERVFCANPAEFALELYNGFGANFGSAIYRTTFLRSARPNIDRYADYSDRPLMFDAAKTGGALILKGRYVQYRLHPEQDSVLIAKWYSSKYLISLQECYRDLLLSGGPWSSACYRFRQIYNISAILCSQGQPGQTTYGILVKIDRDLLAALPLGIVGFVWHSARARAVTLRMHVKRWLQI